jgi:DNA helicase-4
MKFTDGNLRFESYEAILIFSSVSLSCFLILPTYGIAIITTALFWWFYHQSETNRVEEVLQHISHYRERVKSEVDRVKPLSSFESYLPSRDCLELQKPINKLLNEVSKLPRGYSEIWVPLKEELEIQLKFLKKYNHNYINTEQERHNDFFNGNAYHNGNEFNEEQIIAILTNDYNNLIVAGPGAGKTRVLTSRVAFFVKRKGIPEHRILVLAYNKSAAEEVRARLKDRFGIMNVDVRTFHSLGALILHRTNQISQKNAVEEQNEKVMNQTMKELIKSDDEFKGRFMWYLSAWGDDKAKDVNAAKHIDERFRHKTRESYIAIDGTPVKSLAERDIANFFIQNGIQCIYEKKVDWCDKDRTDTKRTYCPDFYLPEYDIYIEHWSVTDAGEAPPFFSPEESERYTEDMTWKRGQFEKHEKTLWETNHTMFATRQLIPELKRNLIEIEAQYTPVSYEELLGKAGLDSKSSDAVSEAIIGVVKSAKVYGLTPSALRKKVLNQDMNSRTPSYEAEFILDLVLPVFESYENYLKEQDKIDYEDMINKAVATLDLVTNGNSAPLNPYDFILVDEFQDISHQRLRFLENLQRINPGSRLYCVGDDWQAIYGFAGSSALYMIQFEKHFPSPARVALVQNYRNPSDILDFASTTIKMCKRKINKELQPRLVREDEGIDNTLMFHRLVSRNEFDFKQMQNEEAFVLIKALIEDGVNPEEIMVLSRFHFGYSDLREACKRATEIPVELRKKGLVVRGGVRFLSIHTSKGLEAEYVIILNVTDGLYGFPPEFSKELEFAIINPDLPYRLDEERRLLFVAATRAKKQCIAFTRKRSESPLLVENKYFRKHFPSEVGRVFKGQIIEERPKAYRIEVHLSPSVKHYIWVPKSVTSIRSSKGTDPLQEFELKERFYKQKRTELNRGL